MECNGTEPNDLKILSEIVKNVAPEYGFLRVYLFGSRARGDHNSNSDYDFCVTPGKTTDLLDLGGFLMDMEEALNSNVDVISERGMKTAFKKSIEKDMVLLYEA